MKCIDAKLLGITKPVAAGLLCLALLFCSLPSFSQDTLTIVCPDVQHPYYAERDKYFHKLLRLAIARSGMPARVSLLALPEYKENRSVYFLETERYDVHWLNTTEEREASLLPIRIPLYKGSIGWRAMFIRPEMQEQFSQIQTLDDLKQMLAGQGRDWADIGVLKMSGLPVEPSSNWEGLFKMLKLDRIQYFPRSIVEILAESKVPAAEGLIIEKTLILKYPAAYYFFVNKNNTYLAHLLETGLNAAIKDGSFDALFNEYFGDTLSQLNLANRKILSIPNPLLEPQMPLDRPELWFRIEP